MGSQVGTLIFLNIDMFTLIAQIKKKIVLRVYDKIRVLVTRCRATRRIMRPYGVARYGATEATGQSSRGNFASFSAALTALHADQLPKVVTLECLKHISRRQTVIKTDLHLLQIFHIISPYSGEERYPSFPAN